MDEVLANYNNLPGQFLGERRKNLNHFLSQSKSVLDSEDKIKTFVDSLSPKGPVEEVFYVDVLIYFRRNAELLDVLKNGTQAQIGKLLNYWKFFEETFEDVDPQTLTDEIFPHLSYSNRTKVINRLVKNVRDEDHVDKYFHAIQEKYGMKSAAGLLPGCTLNVITETVANQKVKLSNRQLISIVKKFEQFLEFYFDVHDKRLGTYDQTIRFVADKHPARFWRLFDKHKLSVKVGKRVTPRLIKERDDFLTKPKNYIARSSFSNRSIYNAMERNDQKIIRFLISYDENDLRFYKEQNSSFQLARFLKCMPKSHRYVFAKAYLKERYGMDLEEHPDCFSKLMLIMAPQDVRDKILDEKIKSDELLYYMYNPEKCVRLLKERITYTSDISKRITFTDQLVHTCAFHKDEQELLKVLGYVLFRHKNDTIVLSNIMTGIENWPDLEKLGPEWWKNIHDIVKLLEVGNLMYSYRKIPLMEKYLKHLIHFKQPTDEYMKEMLSALKELGYDYNIFSSETKYAQMCFEKFVEILPTVFEAEELHDKYNQLLRRFMIHNLMNKEKLNMEPFQVVMERLSDKFETRIEFKTDILPYMIYYYEKDGKFSALYWKHYDTCCNNELNKWYAKKKPQQIMDHLECLMKYPYDSAHNTISMVFSELRRRSTAEVSKRLKSLCLDFVKEKQYSCGTKCVVALSVMKAEDEYLELVRELYPAESVSRARNIAPDENIFFDTLIGRMRALPTPSKVLPVAAKFCNSNCSKSLLPVLYTIAAHEREHDLPHALTNLSKSTRMVSLQTVSFTRMFLPKKHFVHLLNKVTPQQMRLRQTVIKNTLGYFTENPSEKLWPLVENNLKHINVENCNLLKYFVEVRKNVPQQFVSKYILTLHTVISASHVKDVEKFKSTLLSDMPKRAFVELPIEFLTREIRNAFVKDKSYAFALKCVFENAGRRRFELFDFTMGVVEEYVNTKWRPMVIGPVRLTLDGIVQSFCRYCVTYRVDELIEPFTKKWSSMFAAEEMFNATISLNLTEMYLECNRDIPAFVVKTNEHLGKLVRHYDASVIKTYGRALKNFLTIKLQSFDDDDLEKYIDAFVAVNNETYTYLATLELLEGKLNLPGREPKALGKLKACNVDIVQVYLRCLLVKDKDDECQLFV